MLMQCGIFGDFEPPFVVSVTPLKDSVNVDEKITVVVQFSERMEPAVTEKAFSLVSEGASVDGYFTWSDDGRLMTFTPEYPLKKGRIYYIKITENAEDKKGNNLENEIYQAFTVGSETVKPYVVSTYPAYGTIGIPKESDVVITFSEPVDKSSVLDSVSFSPSFQYQLIMENNNTTARFDPVSTLEYGTTYNIDVGAEIKDLEGNKLLEPYQFMFTVGDDFTSPQLVSIRNSSSAINFTGGVINHDVEKDDSIILDFSKPMNRVNTENYISFSPSVAGGFYWESETRVAFSPSGIFDLDQIYTVCVSRSLTDTNGNELDREYSYLFQIDGSDSQPVLVNKISDTINDPWVNNQLIMIDAFGNFTNLCIHFSSSMNQIKVIDNIDVEYTGGSGSGIGLGISRYIWNSPDDDVLRIDLKGLDSGNIYKLEIKGGKDGVRDKKDNYMKEYFVIFFKT